MSHTFRDGEPRLQTYISDGLGVGDPRYDRFQPLCGPEAITDWIDRKFDAVSTDECADYSAPVRIVHETNGSLGDFLFDSAVQPDLIVDCSAVEVIRQTQGRKHGFAKFVSLVVLLGVTFAAGDYVGESHPVINKLENLLGTGKSPLPPLINIVPNQPSGPTVVPSKATPNVVH
jgi:hypothetical protein